MSELPSSIQPGQMRQHWRRALAVLLACVLLVVLLSVDLLYEQLQRWLVAAEPLISAHPVLGAVLFVVLSALSALLAFFSSALLVPVAVYTWGQPATIALLWLGWLLGGVFAYTLGHVFGRPLVRTLLSARVAEFYLERLPRRVDFPVALLIQLALPSEVPGYLFGVLRVRFAIYLGVLAIVEAGFIDKARAADGQRIYRWMVGTAPFAEAPVELAPSPKLIQRFGWTSAGTPYFTTRGDTAAEVSYQVVQEGGVQPIWKGVTADRYDNPGRGVRLDGADGPVLEVNGRIFIAGDGLSNQGPRPFLDVFDLRQQTLERVFSAEPGEYEIVLGVLDPELPSFVTSRETESESPNLYLHRGAERIDLHRVPDPYPQQAKATRRVVTYRRADGVALSGTLYLPENHREGEPLAGIAAISSIRNAAPAASRTLCFFCVFGTLIMSRCPPSCNHHRSDISHCWLAAQQRDLGLRCFVGEMFPENA